MVRTLLFLLLCGCTAAPAAFTCFSDEECKHAGQEGRCEQTGFCSFADSSCETGSRYGDYAGNGLGGRCVPVPGSDLDAGPPPPDAMPLPECGAIGGTCCSTPPRCLGGLECTGNTCGCAQLGAPTAGAYAHHTCEIDVDGAASCWGSNSQGQMGRGNSGGVQSKPAKVDQLANISMITAGATHTCAISGGDVWCWGDNDAGQCGFPGGDRPNPKQTNLSSATWIDAAGATTCAVSAGNVFCWGRNQFGQVGDGSTSDRNRPKQVPNLTNVVAVSAGVNFTCALKNDATAWCWGAGDEGEMGDGQGTSSLVPVQVGLSNVAQIVAGDDQACARTTTGLVFCWGDNQFGVIGDGTNDQRRVPTQVLGLSEIDEIDVANEYACARRHDGAVWCWGQNDKGQLGQGSTSPFSNVPLRVLAITDATGIATGAEHVCARLAVGTIVCWGSNIDAQLGDESQTSHLDPTTVRLDCP